MLSIARTRTLRHTLPLQRSLVALSALAAFGALVSLATEARAASGAGVDMSTAELPAAQPGELLRAAAQDYDEQMRQGEFQACISISKTLLEQLAASRDASPLDRNSALVMLARAQQMAGLTAPAMQNYTTAIRTVEQHASILDESIEEPLWELARLQRSSGDIESAQKSYERALHTHTVNEGIEDVGLSDYLDEMTEFYVATGGDSRARALQAYKLSVLQRHHNDSIEVLPAMYSYAHTLEDTGDYIGSFHAYRDIMRKVSRSEGRNSRLMIPVVEDLAELFLYNEMLDGYDGVEQAYRYYRRMINLVERNPDASDDQRMRAYAGMGDYYTLKTNNWPKAAGFYEQAWNIAAAESLEVADERYGRAASINDLPSIRTVQFRHWLNRPQRFGMYRGVVVIRYGVGVDGRVEDPVVVESEPYGFKDLLVLNHLDKVVFRPAVDNGHVVASEGYEYRFEFAYWPREYRQFLERPSTRWLIAQGRLPGLEEPATP